jgi:hypothetical protein
LRARPDRRRFAPDNWIRQDRPRYAPRARWALDGHTVWTKFWPAAPFVRPASKPESTGQVTGQVTGQIAGQVAGQVARQILEFCAQPRTASEIQELVGLRHRETFQTNYHKPLFDLQLLAMTVPDRPRSRLQRYRLRDKGRAWLTSSADSQE